MDICERSKRHTAFKVRKSIPLFGVSRDLFRIESSELLYLKIQSFTALGFWKELRIPYLTNYLSNFFFVSFFRNVGTSSVDTSFVESDSGKVSSKKFSTLIHNYRRFDYPPPLKEKMPEGNCSFQI